MNAFKKWLKNSLKEDFGLEAATLYVRSLKADGFDPLTAHDVALIKAFKRVDGCAITVTAEATTAIKQQRSFAAALNKRASQITRSAQEKVAKIAKFYQSIIDWLEETKNIRQAIFRYAAEQKVAVLARQAKTAEARATEAQQVAEIFSLRPALKVAE